MQPFRQLPWSRLPVRPRRPHPWHDTRAHTVVVHDPHFGIVPIHLRLYGQGPPLLLVHGLMTAGYSWRYVLEPLGRHYTLYVPDLPGAGRSGAPRTTYEPEKLAAFLIRLVDTLELRGVRCIGNSMGGYLCLWAALQDPGVFSRLVNLHSPGVPLKRLHLLHRVLSVPGSFRLLQALVQADPERWVQRQVHYYDESLKSREEAAEYALPLRTSEGVNAFGHHLRDTLDPAAMVRFLAQLDAARPFPIPVQLLYAETDPVVPPWIGDTLHAHLPDAQLHRLSQASHFAHVDAVERFLPPVSAFLAGTEGG